MKNLTIEIFDASRPEHGQDVTLSITHNGYAPDKDGEMEIHMQSSRHLEYDAFLIVSGSQDTAACYAITSDTAIANDTYLDLIASLKSRIVDLFGGCA